MKDARGRTIVVYTCKMWTCPHCKTDNIIEDAPTTETVKCSCCRVEFDAKDEAK